MLKAAIANSERKKYHGEFETIHELPDSSEQFKKILEKTPSYKRYFNVKTIENKKDKKVEVTYEIKEQESQDEEWKKMCINRWAWIKEAMAYEPKTTVQDISAKAVEFIEAGISKPEDRLVKMIEKQYKKVGINYQEPKVDLPKTSWKEMFLRLDLEDFLLHIDMNPDFGEFYEKL